MHNPISCDTIICAWHARDEHCRPSFDHGPAVKIRDSRPSLVGTGGLPHIIADYRIQHNNNIHHRHYCRACKPYFGCIIILSYKYICAEYT